MIASFFIHKSIEAFAAAIIKEHGHTAENALLFPCHAIAERCSTFLRDQVPTLGELSVRIVDLYPNDGILGSNANNDSVHGREILSAVILPRAHFSVAKTFWQHSGEGVSSRRAEYCHKAFKDGRLTANEAPVEHVIAAGFTTQSKGPRRYQKKDSIDLSPRKQPSPGSTLEGKDCTQFVEERFGRNLDVSLACNAKLAIRRRIADALTANVDLKEALEMHHTPTRTTHVVGFSEHDVYLYPTGMSSIFNTHRTLMACRGRLKSVSFGSVTHIQYNRPGH